MELWTTALTAALGGGAALAALSWLRRRGIEPGLALTLLRTVAAPPDGAGQRCACADLRRRSLRAALRPSAAAGRAARVARWLHDYPRQFAKFRDSDGRPPQHTFFFPLEEYQAGIPRRPRRAVPAGVRRSRGPSAPRRRHRRERLAARSPIIEELLAEQHGLLACHRDDGRDRLRLHPRQLGAVQLPARRPLVRRRQRAGRSSRDRLLRRLHVAVRARMSRRRRRSTASTTRAIGRAGRDRTTAASTWRGAAAGQLAYAAAGSADAQLAAAQVGRVAAGSRTAASRPPSRRARPLAALAARRACRCRAGRTGSSSSCTATARRRTRTKRCSARPMTAFHEP